MPTYTVEVCRTSYGFHTFQVTAADEESARDEAYDQAGDCLYTEKSAEYEVVAITRKCQKGDEPNG